MDYKLTEYSHGAGCGCKIAPKVLDSILKKNGIDRPEDFGQIASVNAISDIYAMGGTPLMAIAILGWPISTIPPEVANQVIEGGRKACAAAGIPLAGGHSIDSPEPIFGLAVTGRVPIKHSLYCSKEKTIKTTRCFYC